MPEGEHPDRQRERQTQRPVGCPPQSRKGQRSERMWGADHTRPCPPSTVCPGLRVEEEATERLRAKERRDLPVTPQKCPQALELGHTAGLASPYHTSAPCEPQLGKSQFHSPLTAHADTGSRLGLRNSEFKKRSSLR